MSSRLDLIPGVRVGPFFFGAPVSKAESLGMVFLEDDWVPGSSIYGGVGDSVHDIVLYVEGGIITGAGIYQSVFYNNVDLIGASLSEAVAALGGAPSSSDEEELSDGKQKIYYWDELEITLWVKDGIVVTVQCSEFLEEVDGLGNED